MRRLFCNIGTVIGLMLLSTPALATQEEMLDLIGKLPLYTFFFFVIVIILAVFFMRIRDKRVAPLSRIFEERDAIHAVGPDALVSECVCTMTAEKIGAIVIMDNGRLIGIFTERDALNRVLAAGLDPVTTKISEVMTSNPYCIPPTTTVAEAMKLVTQRRFRHLPIVENGRVLAVVSSGDLTHWMVQDQIGEVQELVDIAARS